MMVNLFSVFDPASGWDLPLNWISVVTLLLVVPPVLWSAPNRISTLVNGVWMGLHREFSLLLGPSANLSSAMIALLTFIFLNNFLGLAPYIFTSSSHMSFSLSMSLPFWGAFLLYGWIKHTQHMFAHLIPEGTPSFLMSFMVLVESVSIIIRPLTLGVRLSANMMAGHLLLTLVGELGVTLSNSGLVSLALVQSALVVLELAVACIQSYVFAILTTLYATEVECFSSMKSMCSFQLQGF